MRLTRELVLGRFRRCRPKDADEALRFCRVPLTFLGEGAFRRTYQIGDLPLVVKFPYDEYLGSLEGKGLERGIVHSTVEMRALRKLRNKKYAEIHNYLPKVYYHGKKHGVIIMHKYFPIRWGARAEQRGLQLEEKIQLLAADAGWMSESLDVSPNNTALDEKGKLVLIDLGCFEDSWV